MIKDEGESGTSSSTVTQITLPSIITSASICSVRPPVVRVFAGSNTSAREKEKMVDFKGSNCSLYYLLLSRIKPIYIPYQSY